MQDINLFHKKLLRLGDDWDVTLVSIDERRMRVDIHIEYLLKEGPCPETGELCKVHDHKEEREWRHLDSMGYSTYIHCRLPRIKNSEGQIKTMALGWAEKGAGYTVHFENRCVDTLQGTHTRVQASKLMNTSDDMICGMMHAAVDRGLERRDFDKTPVRKLCIDEKSIGKGQKYISVLSDGESGAALEVAKGRDGSSVADLIDKTFTTKQLEGIAEVCCDMWEAFMNTLKKNARMQYWYMTNFMLSNT
jgi:transposase